MNSINLKDLLNRNYVLHDGNLIAKIYQNFQITIYVN